MRHWLLSLCLCAVSGPVFARGGEIGNGGDQIDLIFDKAKTDGYVALRSYKPAVARELLPTLFPDDTPEMQQTYITWLETQNQGESIRYLMMAQDLANVIFERMAIPEGQPTCAWTNYKGDAHRIYFDLEKCRKALDGETQSGEAIRLLVHETSHHFGVAGEPKDERFANRIAILVYETWQASLRNAKLRWSPITLNGRPAARYHHAAAWVGDKMWVWGGCNESVLEKFDDCKTFLSDGAFLTVSGRQTKWEKLLPTVTTPTPRSNATSVWTGTDSNQVYVWGGYRRLEKPSITSTDDAECVRDGTIGVISSTNKQCTVNLKSGGVFDVATRQWTLLSERDAPVGRVRHAMVWTGKSLFVWGGATGVDMMNRVQTPLNDGGLYSPETHSWEPIVAPSWFKARQGHTMVWANNKVVIWGGCDVIRISDYVCRESYNDGALFNPETKRWTPLTPNDDTPEARHFHSAVWTGKNMIIFGGVSQGSAIGTGAVLDVDNNHWEHLSTLLPAGSGPRFDHSSAWTGDELIVWGGMKDWNMFASDGMRIKALDADAEWKTLGTDTMPLARKGATTVWNGQQLIIWGGWGENDTFLGEGAILQVKSELKR